MIEFTVNGKLNSLPENFSEFSPRQWRFFFRVLCSGKSLEWEDVKVAFVKKFTSIPVRKIRKLGVNVKNEADWEEFLEHSSRVRLLTSKMNFFEQTINIPSNPLPYLSYGFLGFRKLYPPSDGLGNLLTWEMAFATKYSSLCSVNMADKEKVFQYNIALDKMIATIYRPGRPMWKLLYKYGYSPEDRRRKFYDSLIDAYAVRLRKIPLFKKMIIFSWFNSQYKEFSKQFESLFNQVSNGNADDFSWADMIISVEGSMPGDEEKIGNSSAAFFLQRLVLNKKMLEHIKEKQTKNK
jgi:hypothetical protein